MFCAFFGYVFKKLQCQRGTLSPRLGTADDTKYVLDFTSGHIDLSNIDFNIMMKDVGHLLQAKGQGLTAYCDYSEMTGGTFQWMTFINSRDPVKRTTESPTITSRASSFSRVGMNVVGYDDLSLVPDITEFGSKINVKGATFAAMMHGFNRLRDRLILSACVQPRISQSTGSNQWKTAENTRTENAMPLTHFGGRLTGTGSSYKLDAPNLATLQLAKKTIYDRHVDRSQPLYSVLNPYMEYVIENLTQYQNRDYIFSQTVKAIHEKAPVVPFYGINFIRIDDDLLDHSHLDGKLFDLSATPATALGNPSSGTAASNDITLGDGTSSTTKYTVIPIWAKPGICWTSAPKLNKAAIYKVPYYRMTPLVEMVEYLGASRTQDDYVYNLVVPTDI